MYMMGLLLGQSLMVTGVIVIVLHAKHPSSIPIYKVLQYFVISSLSSLSSDNLLIKIKYKNVNSSSAQKWWFVVRADEPLLQELDSQWDTIALQTSWQLTPLLQYIPASEIMARQSDTAYNNVADNEVTNHFETMCDTIDMDVHSNMSAFVDCLS